MLKQHIKEFKSRVEEKLEGIEDKIEALRTGEFIDTTLDDVDGIRCSWNPLYPERYTGVMLHTFRKIGDNAFFVPNFIAVLLATVLTTPLIVLLVVVARDAGLAGYLILLGFISVIVLLINALETPIQILKDRGIIWKGLRAPVYRFEPMSKSHALIENVIAVQTLSKIYKPKNIKCYELNLIISESERFHLITYSNHKKYASIIEKFTEFLGVPHFSNISTVEITVHDTFEEE